MITFINHGKINAYYGLSTDTKPLDAPNASTFYEMDTGALYLFDKDNATWLEQ
jgi:hypothetical protein